MCLYQHWSTKNQLSPLLLLACLTLNDFPSHKETASHIVRALCNTNTPGSVLFVCLVSSLQRTPRSAHMDVTHEYRFEEKLRRRNAGVRICFEMKFQSCLAAVVVCVWGRARFIWIQLCASTSFNGWGALALVVGQTRHALAASSDWDVCDDAVDNDDGDVG